MSFCIPRRSLCHRIVPRRGYVSLFASRLFLSAFFQQLRALPLFFSFSRAFLSPNSFSLLPRSLVCRPFVSLSIPLDYVFFSRISFLFLIPLSFFPQFTPLSPDVSPFFSVFVSFLERSSTSATLSLFLPHFCSLFFGRIGLSFSFLVVGFSPVL